MNVGEFQRELLDDIHGLRGAVGDIEVVADNTKVANIEEMVHGYSNYLFPQYFILSLFVY